MAQLSGARITQREAVLIRKFSRCVGVTKLALLHQNPELRLTMDLPSTLEELAMANVSPSTPVSPLRWR